MSTELIKQLKAQLAQLEAHSAVDYALGQTPEGRSAILAGGVPVFRCRSDETGQAHADFLVAGMPVLVSMLRAPSLQAAKTDTDQVRNRDEASGSKAEQAKSAIASAISLQPELAPRAQLLAKLVYASVEPFLGGEAEAFVASRMEPAVQSVISPNELRDEVASSLADWLEERATFPLSKEGLASSIIEWEAQHA